MLAPEVLEAAALRGDALADEAVAALAPALVPGADPWTVALRSEHVAARRLVADVSRPPADPALVERACRWALRYAPAIGIALATRSLLMLYAVPEIARSLVRTGRLAANPERRTLETARFLYEVGRPECFAPGGRAVEAIGRVRLLHAVTRARLAPRWEGPGPPIDQRSSLFTLCVFGGGLRQGMARLGVEIPEGEARDQLGMWRHLGARLGVEPALIPAEPDEEIACITMLQAEICRPSPEGRALARALLGGIAGRPPYLLPEGALVAMAHFMLGEELACILDLPPQPRWARIPPRLLPPLTRLDRAGRAVPPLRGLAERFGRVFSGGILRWRLRGPADYEVLPPAGADHSAVNDTVAVTGGSSASPSL